MSRPSTVVVRIMAAITEYCGQGHLFPGTSDGKVNVIALCRELNNVNEADAQHFHKKDEIKAFVNIKAIEQGLLPIGHRALQDDADIEIEQRIRQTSAQAKGDAQSAVEANSAKQSLFEELKLVRAEIIDKDLKIAALKERLRLIEEGGFFVRL